MAQSFLFHLYSKLESISLISLPLNFKSEFATGCFIATSAFGNAGAGNPAVGVNIMSKNIGVECKNIAAQEMLNARLEVKDPQQDIIRSNNPDVGFQVADQDNRVLTPNNFNSRIPFKLDENARSRLILKSWPVSITGKRPSAGPVDAEGHIRIDFD